MSDAIEKERLALAAWHGDDLATRVEALIDAKIEAALEPKEHKMVDVSLISNEKGITEIDGNSQLEFTELTLSVAEVRHFLDTGEMSSEFETAFDKAQGDAKIQGEAKFLVVIIQP